MKLDNAARLFMAVNPDFSISTEEPRHLRNWYAPLEEIYLGNDTYTGKSVSPNGALKNTAVYACVRVLSESIAGLPLHIYARRNGQKQRANDFYLYSILHDAPNPVMTSFEFREALQTHLLLWGNAYCEIEADGRGRVTALWPLRPDKMEKVEHVGSELFYRYRLPNGATKDFRQEQIWHLRGMSGDGIHGYSPIQLARQAVALSNAAEEFGGRFFGNDARPGGALSTDGVLDDESYERIKRSWAATHQGVSNSHRVAILEQGLSWEQIGMPLSDAQFLETRKFQISDIARIYRVPPHMIGDLERATFSNIEHQSLEFVMHSLRPWLVRWEQSIKQKLMLKKERKVYFAEFSVDGLLRGDTKSRYEAYGSGILNGWITRNEVRALENLNPLTGLDEPLTPLNMTTDTGGTTQQTNSKPTKTEQRGRKAAEYRQWIAKSQEKILREALERVLRREANDIGNKLPKWTDIEAEMDAFYEDFRAWIIRYMQPGYQALGELVGRAAADEVDGDAQDLEKWTETYLERYAARHIGKSKLQITAALEDDALDETLTAWREERPASVAHDESVRYGNAVAKTTWIALSIQGLRWAASGSETCPYCRGLDGKTIAIDKNFLEAGESFQPAGAEAPLIASGSIGHAPAHRGCDCTIRPVKIL